MLLSAGCLPFFGGGGEPPRTPAAVQRFVAAATSLELPPTPTPLPEATRLLAGAVESLPNAPAARERARAIEAQARAMRGDTADDRAARRSIELALEAVESMRKPAGSKRARARALADVREAVGVAGGYRALAQALVLFTSGAAPPSGVGVSALVARFAIADEEGARRLGPQVVSAIADELRRQGADAGDLARRADRLAGAAPLEYAPALRDALDGAVEALGRLRRDAPAFDALRSQARDAVERIARDVPFELQRPAAQDALRLVADALTVAARSGAGGR